MFEPARATSLLKTTTAQFFSSASLFAAGIFIPIILDREMGASKVVIGIVVTSYATAVFLASVIFGRAADIQGRRKYLRIGFAVASVGTFLQIFATEPFALLLVRILLGTAGGIISSVLVAYFIYETKREIGKFSSFGALGWGVGSIIAGAMGDSASVFIFSTGLMVIATAAVFLLPKTSEERHAVPLFPTKVFKENAAVYTSVLIRHIGANFIWVTYPLFLMDELGADAFWVGIIYMVNAFGQFFVMRHLDRFNSISLVAVGLGLSAVTFLMFAITLDVYQVLPIQILLAASWSAMYVGGLKYVTERNVEKATSTGWLQGVISIAGIVGPVMGGLLDETIGFRWTMIAAMILSIAGLAVFLASKKTDPVFKTALD